MENETYTVVEAAQFLGLAPATLYQYRATGRGPECRKEGRRLAFPYVQLVEFKKARDAKRAERQAARDKRRQERAAKKPRKAEPEVLQAA